MTVILSILQIVTTLFSVIPILVKTFESSGIPGDVKKQAVMDTIKAMLESLVPIGLKVPISLVLNMVSVSVDAIVSGYNLIGLFKHDAGAAA